MRFMILVKATPESEAGVMPSEALLKEMIDFHGELAKAGVLVDGSGLQARSKGWRIKYDGKSAASSTALSPKPWSWSPATPSST